MANQVGTKGAYISSAGGSIIKWDPIGMTLQNGQIGWDGYPTLANLQSVSQQAATPVPFQTLLTNIAALSSAQRTNIWTDFNNNTRWKTDTGANTAIIQLNVFIANGSFLSLSLTDLANARNLVIAYYVQDNTSYLVTPTFDPTINVPGTQLQ